MTMQDTSSQPDKTIILNEKIGTDSPIRLEVMVVIQWIFFAVVCQIIDIVGIGANIINITCFLKQGFKDPINVSLLGLAISDLGCLTTLIWTNICNTPAFSDADLPFDTVELQHLTAAMPHTTFARVTAWITAFITFERCLCIAAPLKVKSIITSRRVCMIIVSFFIILIFSVAPFYVVARLGQRFDVSRNRTILGLVYTDNREEIEHVSFPINNVFIPFTAFTVIISCTLILVVELKRKTQWRMESTTSVQADSIASRNQKVAKMVVIISALFIVCFIPISFGFIAMVLVPELSLDGRYRNILIIIGAVCFLLESVNSSVNIIIYFNMSGKYRNTLRQLLCHNTSITSNVAHVYPAEGKVVMYGRDRKADKVRSMIEQNYGIKKHTIGILIRNPTSSPELTRIENVNCNKIFHSS